MAYRCYESHQEDLTETVKRLLNDPPAQVATRVTRVSGDGQLAAFGTESKWKVHVTCSLGHENIFEGVGSV